MYKSLPCGCAVDIELTGCNETWTGVDIEYCSKHAAAPDLLEALEAMMRWIGPPPTDKYSYDSTREDAWNKARDALDQATAQD